MQGVKRFGWVVWAAIAVALCLGAAYGADGKTSGAAGDDIEMAKDGVYVLTDFGDVSAKQQAQQTLDRACQWILERGGGVLVVPPSVTNDLEIRNNYRLEPPPGGPRPWVTILDYRHGWVGVHPPQTGNTVQHGLHGWVGTRIIRVVDRYLDNSPWEHNNVVELRNAIIRGGSSVLRSCDVLRRDGEVRLYPETIRGIFPGQLLGFSMPGVRKNITVKSIGWDTDRKQHYFTADLELLHCGP